MIELEHPSLSVVRQCELVPVSRPGFYYQLAGETPLDLALMRLIGHNRLPGETVPEAWAKNREA